MWILFFIITFILQTAFSLRDLKYREFRSFKPILISYIPALCGGYLLYGVSFDLFFGFFYLAITFYLVELIGSGIKYKGKSEEERLPIIGGIDIVAAPIYTIWFGLGFIPFLAIFVILVKIFSYKPVVKILDRICINKNLVIEEVNIIPFLPILQTCCLIVFVFKIIITP